MNKVKYRHELKFILSPAYAEILKHRLAMIMSVDENSANEDNTYFIRSLYFDSPTDIALREKLDGVSRREKFRIRYYNHDTSLIHLEKKSKLTRLGNKQSANLTAEEAQKIVDGDIGWMLQAKHPLIRELYSKMQTQQLRPKTIVDYVREPYVYAPGNVRVTLDYDIRTGLGCTDFLNQGCPTIPAGDCTIILEVKWDEFLPDIIRSAVQLEGRRVTAFSKYAQCRIYG